MSWTEASPEKSEVVGCVHEKYDIIYITLKILHNDKQAEEAGTELGQVEEAILANIWYNWISMNQI